MNIISQLCISVQNEEYKVTTENSFAEVLNFLFILKKCVGLNSKISSPHFLTSLTRVKLTSTEKRCHSSGG
jgi:hypothetical protein